MIEQAFRWARSRMTGFDTARATPLRAEASFRAFYRLEAEDGRSLVLMISPPDREQNEQFERLAGVFGGAGLPVPVILDADRPAGWYLMTDLGRRELVNAYGTPDEPAALEAALNTLIDLQTVADPAIPPYTGARFRDELGIFTEWFVAGMLKASLPPAMEPVFHSLVTRAVGQRVVCVHRDYHCRNLLFDPATGRLGVVDFQDALMGPVSYDLASLLHDCYHRFSDHDVDYWRDWYLRHSPQPLDPATFASDLTMMAVQRQLKAVGIFARLLLRDGKASHLQHIPPVLDHLTDLSRREPGLAPLTDWLGGLDRAGINETIDVMAKRVPGAA